MMVQLALPLEQLKKSFSRILPYLRFCGKVCSCYGPGRQQNCAMPR